MAFVELKDWDKRKLSAMDLQDKLNEEFTSILDGQVDAQLPPSVPGVGHSDGFVFRLEDRGGVGLDAPEGRARSAVREGQGGSGTRGRALRRSAGCAAH